MVDQQQEPEPRDARPYIYGHPFYFSRLTWSSYLDKIGSHTSTNQFLVIIECPVLNEVKSSMYVL